MKLFLFFLFIIMITSATALSEEEFHAKVLEQKEDSVGKTLRAPVSFMFGNERTNIVIETISDEWKANVITENGKIIDVGFDHVDDATILVTSNPETVDAIDEAEDPLPVFLDALNSNEISVEAFTTSNKIKLAVAKSATAVMSWFV